jgi:hypothetical protein
LQPIACVPIIRLSACAITSDEVLDFREPAEDAME